MARARRSAAPKRARKASPRKKLISLPGVSKKFRPATLRTARAKSATRQPAATRRARR